MWRLEVQVIDLHSDRPTSFSSAVRLLGGISRRFARYVPFRPYRLKLEAPVVAFTFDDFPASAVEHAAPALEDAGMRGTYYLASGLMGRIENGQRIADAAMVAALAARNHEIGGHTHNHINVQRTARNALLADVRLNERKIAEIVGETLPISFAYPFGVTSIRSKMTLMHRYLGLRGITTGINSDVIDLAHLLTQELYDCSSDVASIDRVLDALERRNGWLIFYTHDVRVEPTSIGCSPGYFAAVVDRVRRRGIQVETVAKTLTRIGVRQRARSLALNAP